MKITKKYLQRIIQEETQCVLKELLGGGRPSIALYVTREELGRLNGRYTALRQRIADLEKWKKEFTIWSKRFTMPRAEGPADSSKPMDI